MTLKSPYRGIQGWRRRHDALYGSRSYVSKVMGFGPIAYWPLWEATGTVAHCMVNAAQNGTYNSDVALWPVGAGIGDGHTAPYFSGNDFVNVFSIPFRAAFDGTEGTTMIWARVANAGVWIDGTIRESYRFQVDGNNLSTIRRVAGNNTLGWYHFAGGVIGPVFEGGITTTGWMCLVSSWSETANEQNAYRDAVNNGTLASGAWAGVLASCIIGATDAGPNFPWLGWLAHCAVWDYALTPTEITALAAV